ncbi:hypothetical protein OH76DRAFT_1422027 [Lentinus brumalis]|uniref:Uncharacterized protein n=1 Tax=Lentinus brumalis TaxID=2498619 RepID=A0A371CSN6_9APHY|nr:hypothetical protein OH76DRAFT_1422027 [Polyporus brumalis]
MCVPMNLLLGLFSPLSSALSSAPPSVRLQRSASDPSYRLRRNDTARRCRGIGARASSPTLSSSPCPMPALVPSPWVFRLPSSLRASKDSNSGSRCASSATAGRSGGMFIDHNTTRTGHRDPYWASEVVGIEPIPAPPDLAGRRTNLTVGDVFLHRMGRSYQLWIWTLGDDGNKLSDGKASEAGSVPIASAKSGADKYQVQQGSLGSSDQPIRTLQAGFSWYGAAGRRGMDICKSDIRRSHRGHRLRICRTHPSLRSRTPPPRKEAKSKAKSKEECRLAEVQSKIVAVYKTISAHLSAGLCDGHMEARRGAKYQRSLSSVPLTTTNVTMDLIQFYSHAKVVFHTEKLTLCIEQLNDSHGIVNEGFYLSYIFRQFMLSPQDALLAVPTSGKDQAYLEPPEHVVLNFWDEKLSGSAYENKDGSTFKLDNFGIRTRYVFRFQDNIEHAKCMELFFITRRVMVERAREVEKRTHDIAALQDEILAAMKLSIPPAYYERA